MAVSYPAHINSVPSLLSCQVRITGTMCSFDNEQWLIDFDQPNYNFKLAKYCKRRVLRAFNQSKLYKLIGDKRCTTHRTLFDLVRINI